MATKITPKTAEQATLALVQIPLQSQVQYVMMEKSLRGVGGWLIFAPLLATGYITSVVTMAMEKRIGKLITWITLGVSAVHSVIILIVSYVTTHVSYNSYSYSRASDKELSMLIGTILISLLIHGLVALYFALSRRIKETLVK